MDGRWWRAVSVYRGLGLAFALAVGIADRDRYSRPALAFALIGVMAAWTLLATLRHDRRLVLVELGLAVGLVLASRAVYAPHSIDTGAATLPGPWVAAAVLACAVTTGPYAGLAAAAVVGAADFIERGSVTQITAYGVVLLLAAGGVGGYVVRLSERAEAAIDAAARLEAATGERERLARDIHDSVLQVLALVARRGSALGGDAADLARLAGEQEIALRALVATPRPDLDAQGEIDLRALLEPLASERVTVSGPAEPVRMPADQAGELLAATQSALHNVERHAGDGARAWVLVEQEAGEIVVSIRDDGVGVDATRLGQARADGRLGVAQSILGRMQAIGGSATVDGTPGAGTEVELRVPRS